MSFSDTIWGRDPEKIDLDREDTNLQNGAALRDKANAGYDAAGNRAAPTAGNTQLGAAAMGNAATIDQSQQAQFRNQQMGLAGQLAAQAAGQGPSVAGAQFKAAADTNLAQQQALAASGRGGNAAMAGRQAAQNASGFNQQAAQGAATARMQEQMNAQSMLGNVLNQGRGSDIGLATSQAGFNQQTGLANQGALNSFALQQGNMNQATSLANLQAQIAQTGMNDAQQMAYLSQLTGMSEAELQARMQQDALQVSQRDPGSTGIAGDLLAAGGIAAAAYLGKPPAPKAG